MALSLAINLVRFGEVYEDEGGEYDDAGAN
jgi:hypothetical protein